MRHRGLVLTLCLVQFVDVAGATAALTALPSIGADLGSSAAEAGLVVTGYAMLFGGLLITGARLGDRYGHRRVLFASLVGFGLGGLLVSLSWSMPVVVAGRGIQGAAAACSVPAALHLLTTATTGVARARALGLWSGAGGLAGASGLVLGGVVTKALGWRSIGVVLALVGAGLLVLLQRCDLPRATHHENVRLDTVGAVSLTATVMAVVLAATWAAEPPTRAVAGAVLASAIPLGAVFLVSQRRGTEPLVPPQALRSSGVRTGAWASFTTTAVTSSAVVVLALVLGDGGVGSVGLAARILPFSISVVLGAWLAGRLVSRRPAQHAIALGSALMALGLTGLAAGLRDPWTPLLTALPGWGTGFASVGATALGTATGQHLRAVAAGILNTAAQLGGAVGVALAVLVAEVTSPGVAFGSLGALGLGAAVAALRISPARSAAGVEVQAVRDHGEGECEHHHRHDVDAP